MVDEWKLCRDSSDNHWLDGLVGSAVAASVQEAVLFETRSKAKMGNDHCPVEP